VPVADLSFVLVYDSFILGYAEQNLHIYRLKHLAKLVLFNIIPAKKIGNLDQQFFVVN